MNVSADAWLESKIRSKNGRKLAIWLGVSAAVLLGTAASSRYFINFFAGPYAIDAAAVSRISDVDRQSHYFVTVTGERAFDTGVQRIFASGLSEIGPASATAAELFLSGDFVPRPLPPSLAGTPYPAPLRWLVASLLAL